MSEPLTDYERKVWRESAEDILKRPYYYKGDTVNMVALARNRLRYEKTLQAQDELIAALVEALEEIQAVEIGCCMTEGCCIAEPLCTYMIATVAIKGATDAS